MADRLIEKLTELGFTPQYVGAVISKGPYPPNGMHLKMGEYTLVVVNDDGDIGGMPDARRGVYMYITHHGENDEVVCTLRDGEVEFGEDPYKRKENTYPLRRLAPHELMAANGWKIDGHSPAGTTYSRMLKDGTYAIAGNLTGEWGWDTYASKEAWAAMATKTATSEDYNELEYMLDAMRRAGLID